MPKRIDAQQQAAFQADGDLLVRELFATQEISLLNERLAEARGLDGKRFYVVDSGGERAELLSWSGDRPDLLGAYVRVGRLVERAEDLLDGQSVYHWHQNCRVSRPTTAHVGIGIRTSDPGMKRDACSPICCPWAVRWNHNPARTAVCSCCVGRIAWTHSARQRGCCTGRRSGGGRTRIG